MTYLDPRQSFFKHISEVGYYDYDISAGGDNFENDDDKKSKSR